LLVGSEAYAPGVARTSLRRAAARPATLAPVYRVQSSTTLPVRCAASPLMSTVTETPVRSAVKAVGWRITAGIVTAITSYIFTKSFAAAAAIVGWDLCSKSVTMFIGERLWNKVEWGKDAGADSSQRSLAKAIAWRIFAATNTFVGATLLNKGNAGVAGKIAGTDSIVKTALFYFYERAWSTISWGKETESDAAPETVTIDATAE